MSTLLYEIAEHGILSLEGTIWVELELGGISLCSGVL
jgi:hypothetical protein